MAFCTIYWLVWDVSFILLSVCLLLFILCIALIATKGNGFFHACTWKHANCTRSRKIPEKARTTINQYHYLSNTWTHLMKLMQIRIIILLLLKLKCQCARLYRQLSHWLSSHLFLFKANVVSLTSFIVNLTASEFDGAENKTVLSPSQTSWASLIKSRYCSPSICCAQTEAAFLEAIVPVCKQCCARQHNVTKKVCIPKKSNPFSS